MTPGPTRVPERVSGRCATHDPPPQPEFSGELARRSSCSRPCSARAAPCPFTLRDAARSRRRSATSSRPATRSRCAATASSARCGPARRIVRPRRASPGQRLGAGRQSGRGRRAAESPRHPSRRDGIRRHVDRRRQRRQAAVRVARAHGALVLVDAVSSLGGMPFAFDEWEMDVAVTASQKCLMSARASRSSRSANAHGTPRPAPGCRATTGTSPRSAAMRPVRKHRARRPCRSCCRSPRRCA